MRIYFIIFCFFLVSCVEKHKDIDNVFIDNIYTMSCVKDYLSISGGTEINWCFFNALHDGEFKVIPINNSLKNLEFIVIKNTKPNEFIYWKNDTISAMSEIAKFPEDTFDILLE